MQKSSKQLKIGDKIFNEKSQVQRDPKALLLPWMGLTEIVSSTFRNGTTSKMYMELGR